MRIIFGTLAFVSLGVSSVESLYGNITAANRDILIGIFYLLAAKL